MKNHNLAALFDEAARPSFASASDARGLLAPILTVVTRIEKQAAHYRELTVQAEGDPTHNPLLDVSLDAIMMACKSVDIDAKQIFEIARRLGATKVRLETLFAEVRAEIELHESAAAAKSTAASAPTA